MEIGNLALVVYVGQKIAVNSLRLRGLILPVRVDPSRSGRREVRFKHLRYFVTARHREHGQSLATVGHVLRQLRRKRRLNVLPTILGILRAARLANDVGPTARPACFWAPARPRATAPLSRR